MHESVDLYTAGPETPRLHAPLRRSPGMQVALLLQLCFGPGLRQAGAPALGAGRAAVLGPARSPRPARVETGGPTEISVAIAMWHSVRWLQQGV